MTFPSFGMAHERRRKMVAERLGAPRPPEADTIVLAMALVAGASADTDTVTLPVFRDQRWWAVTVELSVDAKSARSSIAAQLADDPSTTDPPPSSAVVVLGDGLVDPSHVALHLTDEGLELMGPVEPIGGVNVLARRLEWTIAQLASPGPLGDIGPMAPGERAITALQRLGPTLEPRRHVVSRIEQAARRTPHAPALTTPWTTLTYDEMMGLVADRHAMLRRRGVRAGDVVGLHLTRSSDLVATILALWEARAAFVPFTGDQPRSRVLTMLTDAGADRIVTDLGRWRSPGRTIESLDVERDIHERRTRRRREAPKSLSDNAYVLFTSSTSGRPKGISVTHANLAHYFQAVTAVMPGAARRGAVLATTPISFDASMLELIWPLTHGWEVVIDPAHDIPIGPMARRRRVTHFNGTPTMATVMLRNRDGREVLETVNHILLGDEPVRADLIAELRRTTRAEITVRYGPTESTVDVTWAAVDDTYPSGTLPIGRPLPGHSVDIVDRVDRSVGALCFGELVVLGDAVAAYVGRTQKPSPFEPRGGSPSFRTGDIVWSDVNGTIHFVGRRDRQVKIRGHRIEPDEIDARLVGHPSVSAAATVALGESATRRLVSFVATAADEFDRNELLDWVRDALPEPMVPATVHRLESLPQSASGRTDLEALRTTARERARDVVDRRALSSTEARVAEIFEDILDVAMVQPHLSIFDLGGNSVTAMRLVSELEALVGHRVNLSALLSVDSVEQIAATINDGRLGGGTATLVPIAEGRRGLPIYCVAGPDGHAVNLRPLGEALGRDFHGLEFAGTDGISPPDPTIEAMADRFAAAVSDHCGHEPVVLGGYAGGGVVALEMARRLKSMGVNVALLFLIDSINPQLETRSLSRKLVDGVRELRAPEDLSPVGVLRNRLVADQLSRRDNLLSATRQSRVPNIVDLTPEFEQAVALWEPRPYDGAVLVVRSAAVVPAHRGWERVVTGPLEAVAVDSGRVRMMLPPDVDDLARQLGRAIERVEAPYLR